MRAISKVLTGSMIAAAALSLAACGGNTTNTTVDNTMVTDMNSTEGMDTMTDNMTAVDGGMNGGMMANDTTMMSNDTMMANDTMMSNTGTMTTNAM
jgi:hypothetical protein